MGLGLSLTGSLPPVPFPRLRGLQDSPGVTPESGLSWTEGFCFPSRPWVSASVSGALQSVKCPRTRQNPWSRRLPPHRPHRRGAGETEALILPSAGRETPEHAGEAAGEAPRMARWSACVFLSLRSVSLTMLFLDSLLLFRFPD